MKKYLVSIILSMLMLLVTSKTAFAATAVAAPYEVKATVNSYNNVKISWTDTVNPVSSEISYNVYRSASTSGPFTLIANVSGKSYIDTGVKRWKTYYYAVRAKRTILYLSIYSSYTYAADSVTPILNVPAFAAVRNSYNSIKTSWAPVEKADCYLLYRASSETGSYEEILKTTNTSYIDTALTTGQKYFYKVCAYTDSDSPNWDLLDPNIVIKSYTTPFSDAASAAPGLSTPSLRYGNIDQDSVAIWNAIEGADGYDGYYIASNNNNYSYTVTFSLPASQRDYDIYSPRGLITFYIRAYRLVGTNKVYGSYASAVWTVGMTGGPIR
jgi:hypothetical protein